MKYKLGWAPKKPTPMLLGSFTAGLNVGLRAFGKEPTLEHWKDECMSWVEQNHKIDLELSEVKQQLKKAKNEVRRLKRKLKAY